MLKVGGGQHKEICHIMERKQKERKKMFLRDWLKHHGESSLVNYQHRKHTLTIHMLEVKFPVSTEDSEAYWVIAAGL